MSTLFKNWAAIAAITDYHLRMALALTSADDANATKLAKGFPECYSETEVQAPIDIRLLMDMEDEVCRNREDWDARLLYLCSHEIIGKHALINLPIISFAKSQEELEEYESCEAGVIPEHAGVNIKFGESFLFKGASITVIENHEGGWIECVPSECLILPDLPTGQWRSEQES